MARGDDDLARTRAEPGVPCGIDCDVLVVGGGINGAGIARDLAGRGMRVVLAEQDDLAAHTSSASTKLVHGGLRYLEHREFALVRKALAEREVLLRGAAHIMWPLRFVLPHAPGMRPAWMVRLGLALYDHLSRRRLLPGSETLDLRGGKFGAPLKPSFQRGFAYSDGWVDDARLVSLCARDAADRGATILTRHRCEAARPVGAGWHARLVPHDASPARTVRARALVNATGPWADSFIASRVELPGGQARHLARRGLRLVRGSHIVVPRQWDGPHAYLFQNDDGRVLFAIPYEDRYTLVGTTDVDHDGSPDSVAISDAERHYLCAQANRFLRQPIVPADIVWSYSGVRPLLADEAADAAAVTRDYELAFSDVGSAPLMTVWGGKITTFRRLAEEAASAIGKRLGISSRAWTAGAPLPGGDLEEPGQCVADPVRAFAEFVGRVRTRHPGLREDAARRMARAYGSRLERIAPASRGADALGGEVAPGVHEAELEYLCRDEWAQTAEDVLWRRSKLGLHLDAAGTRAVADWIAARARR